MYVDLKTQCLHILKSLYGLKQSGYNWFSKLSNNLREIGFEQSTVDPCFFTLKQGGEICRICIWVDDGLVSVSSEELWHKIKAKIHAGSPLSTAGPLEWLLGMAITHDHESCILQISQATRIGALLERYGMHKCKGVKMPLPEHEKYNGQLSNKQSRRTSCCKRMWFYLIHEHDIVYTRTHWCFWLPGMLGSTGHSFCYIFHG